MFFIKMIPLLVHTMMLGNKSMDIGTKHWRTVFFIGVLLLFHCCQVMVLVKWISGLDPFAVSPVSASDYILVIILIGYATLCFFLSKIYNRKRLGRWYVEYKNRRFMKYSKLIVFTYSFINLIIMFLPFILFRDSFYRYTTVFRLMFLS